MTVVAMMAGSSIAMTGIATSQVADLVCETPGSTDPIGPHDSTPSQHRESGAPLSAASQLEWSGPCGTTDTGALERDYDHFFINLEERVDLDIEISWNDVSDDFGLYLFRGRVDVSTVNYPGCDSPGTDPGQPCRLANHAPLPGLGGAQTKRTVSLVGVPAGIYSVRVIYAAVVEGSYRGAASARNMTVERSPDPTEDPSSNPTEDPSSDPDPPERGTYPLQPADPYFEEQWGVVKIGTSQAWQERRATGHGIVIAVVDTGVDLRHPDLSCPGKLLVLEGATVGNNELPQDQDGHGTHVAGIAAACGDNGEGVAGVAPDATIMPVNVYDAFQSSSLLPGGGDGAMAAGIRFATQNGAHVINISLGPNPPEAYLPEVHPETQAALKEARAAGTVIVAAAGNFSPTTASTPSPICGYPSLSRFAVCVGATDADDNVTYYSHLPNNLDREAEERGFGAGVLAPGGANRRCQQATGGTVRNGIVSTYLRTVGDEDCEYPAGYLELSGTSMASPHVAGVAALVYDRLGGQRSLENAEAVVDAIIENTEDLYTPGYDPFSAFGRVDAHAAVLSVEPAEEEDDGGVEPSPSPTLSPTPTPSDPGSPVAHRVSISPREVKGAVGKASELTVTVMDANGEPLSGMPVDWASVGVGELVDIEGTTDVDGRAVATVVSDEPGDQRVLVWTESCAAEARCWDEATRHHGPVSCDVFGTRGDDFLRGTDAAEVFCGFGGSDVIVGGHGNDVLVGHSGSDELYGRAGRDRLLGGKGPDALRGGGGADRLLGGPGRDSTFGGAGRDICRGSKGDRARSCRT